jgi:hypothetical protein
MRNGFSPTARTLDANSPRSSFEPLPPRLQRKIDMRWREWEPWVWIELRHCGIAPGGSPELARLRRQHSENLVALLLENAVTMRTVRRHRLDDPRIGRELRTALIQAALERRRKVWLASGRRLNDPSNWTSWHINDTTLNLPVSANPSPIAPRVLATPQPKPMTIDWIQKLVSKYFHLRELRDQDLKKRSHRRVFVFPRQVAMYIARQVTGASLQEIGRQFGGMHHATVLHSINKIEAMRRSDKALNRTIIRLVDAVAS